MSIRAKRRARPLPTEPVVFPTDPAAWAAAHQRLQDAAADAAAAAERSPYGVAPEHLQAAEQAAQQAVADLGVDEFVVRAIAPGDWELLLGEHPPVEGNAVHQRYGYDPDGFHLAVLAETVSQIIDGEPESSTVEEWSEMLSGPEASFTAGQRNALVNAALRLNETAVVVPSVGKGSGQTHS